MKLHHCADARSLRALWAIEELGVDCELVTLPFPPRVRDKAFLEQNPPGTVPLLVDGETRMSESPGSSPSGRDAGEQSRRELPSRDPTAP